MSLYKGFIPTQNKQAMMSFKDKSSAELLTLEEAQKFNEYAGILADDTILVDIDTEKETEILLNVVKSLELNVPFNTAIKKDKPIDNHLMNVLHMLSI